MAAEATPDLSEFAALSRPKRKLCPVGIALGQLPDGDSASLRAACEADVGVITNSAICQWLKSRGHEASINLVTSHRKATCTCDG